ncbi:uncharacterized protein LODBEIA_P08220 [Lodderomyces beijingensis]|uniref:DNA helicase n=1 Tax=Lodderomyces beijingensis TaxID=1775926 RepID=A0ABP0ZEK5_9ASCO
MSKEYVVVILDASKHMELKRVDQGRVESDFELGLKFSCDYFIQQLLRNRKSDRYCFIIYTLGEIKSIYYDEPISLSHVKEFSESARELHSELSESKQEGKYYDLVAALEDALMGQIANKYARTIFIVSNGLGGVNGSLSDTSTFKGIISKYNITSTFLLMANEHNQMAKQRIANLSSQLDDSIHVLSFDEYTRSGPALKLIGPRCLCDSYMSFASIGDSESKGINLQIQVYPAIRVQTTIRGHDYFVGDKSAPVPVKRDTRYYIKKNSGQEDVMGNVKTEDGSNEADAGDEKVFLPRNEFCHGIQYSRRDVAALTTELEEEATLHTSPGINILGFLKSDKVPIPYLSEESSYVIPSTKFYSDNRIAFNSLVESLLDLNLAAIVRYVQKPDDEVQICVALPQRVAIGEKWAHVLLMTRLAMKEDESVGKFPLLSKSSDAEVDVQMEHLIHSRKLRNDETRPNSIDNAKCGLSKAKPFSSPITKHTSLERMLLATDPSTKRFDHYVRKILYKSLGRKQTSLSEFTSEQDFIEKYLTADEPHTLLNMNNMLDASEEDLCQASAGSTSEIAANLKAELKVKYRKKQSKKLLERKRKFDSAFGAFAGDNDGNFDEFFDIEDMLA